jgi:hypothetical protein
MQLSFVDLLKFKVVGADDPIRSIGFSTIGGDVPVQTRIEVNFALQVQVEK